MKDISIIVPVYNAEKYLVKCLDSLVNQTKKNIEIILVNDGSKDKSIDILNEYKEKYPDMITIISQENQGQSVARNSGIENATGKYIAFVDSDDYVSENMFEKLYEKAIEEDFDVVASNVNCVYPDKNLEIHSGVDFESTEMTKEEKSKLLLNMYTVVWNKIYKREIFENKELWFEPGIWFEDVLFLYKLIPYIKSIANVEENLYQYIQRPNSVTYTYSDKLLDINKMLDKLVEFYEKNGLEMYTNELEYIYVRYMLATYIKRLAKAKDKKKFNQGVKWARTKVKEKFPNYKLNIYLTGFGKGFYLKYFNKLFADLIYYLEKNKMN